MAANRAVKGDKNLLRKKDVHPPPGKRNAHCPSRKNKGGPDPTRNENRVRNRQRKYEEKRGEFHYESYVLFLVGKKRRKKGKGFWRRGLLSLFKSAQRKQTLPDQQIGRKGPISVRRR